MPVEIRIKADPTFEALRAAFLRFPTQVGSYLRRASQFAAFAVERESKILSPVDTGRLRSSISVSLGIMDRGLTSIVQTNVNYASIVHEGWGYGKNSKERPFMEQGARAAEREIGSYYQDQISSALQLLKP